MSTSTSLDNKQKATAFLQLIGEGKIDEAYQTYVVPDGGTHHNLSFPAGFSVLQQAMKEAHVQFPHKVFTIKHVIAEDDLVAVHSHMLLEPHTPGYITLHLFRFNNEKIIEMWDCAQAIQADSPNADGAF